MKIIEILPELDIGGVERHVIDLSNELARRGHKILVVSAGGQMQKQLSANVEHRCLPVHKKNPFTGYFCARKISKWVKNEGWQIIHAHSRVPAWIAMWVSSMTKIPFVVTAHADFSTKTHWIYKPYRKAAVTICVSEAVRAGMSDCFYGNTKIITNGLDMPMVKLMKPTEPPVKFLFIGRLSKIKGIQDVLAAMPQDVDWTLDIVGDGSMADELKKLAKELNISDKVNFHGFSDKTDEYMAQSSCLLFPSHEEGFGLVLARAAQIGLPFIASNIASVAAMTGTTNGLLPPGDVNIWHDAIVDFIKTGQAKASIPLKNIPTLAKMVDNNEKIYRGLINGKGPRK
jgi:glycosyltransferase involved in cell wall biosynthesis